MFASVRGTRIYFDVEGMGLVPDGPTMRERPVAMVIHGGPGGDHSGFKPGFTPLAARMQLVYFDHRGQGRSDAADPATYTLDENVEDMEALRRHLGLGPIVSIGTSYGGMVAMAHAARHPDAVSHLVLIVTAAHGGFIPRAQEIVRERGTDEQRQVCEKVWAGNFRSAEEAGRARTIHSPEALNRAFGPEGFLRRFDLRSELGRITAPTLVLAGRHDWICPPEFSEEIARLIPRADLRVFERSSHSIRGDEPEAMVDAILGFMVYR
jgi:proline iminopeptidase